MELVISRSVIKKESLPELHRVSKNQSESSQSGKKKGEVNLP